MIHHRKVILSSIVRAKSQISRIIHKLTSLVVVIFPIGTIFLQIFVCVAVKGLKNENAPSAGTESVDFIECGYLHYSRVIPAKRRLHSDIATRRLD